ncbi:ATP-binding protein [Paracoccus angustae]|uniref:ATP-binding protein n=1 Tax=Paracoccus angustae TaxID=1671480 RepID=A0ABV7U2Z4_9RHOB
MRIRAVELTNIRRFAGQTARIGGIGDGITVLSEPNEFGKSTFFDALHALFFERHRATRAAVKALQPHAGGAPEAAVEIDLPQGRFRIEKRWLSRPAARVRQDGRILAQDDEAEAWIDRLAGQGLSGPSGLLWVRQGLLGLEPEGGSAGERAERDRALSARRGLLSSVAGEIGMITGGRRLDAVAARVEEALARLATATGRPRAGGEWARAEAEAEALRLQAADLAAKAARLSGELARRTEAQRQMRDLDDPQADQRRKEALAAAQKAQAEAEAHLGALEDARRALALAAATADNGRAAIDRLEALSGRVARAQRDLAAARGEAARHENRADALAATDRDAALALAQARDRVRGLGDRLGAAQRARLAQAARDRAEQLGRSLAEAERLRAALEADRARRGLLAVTPQALAAAEQARDDHDRLAARLDAQSVTLSLSYSGAARLREGGSELPEGPHRLTTARVFDLPGIGTLRIDPGLQTGGDETRLARAAASAEAGDPSAIDARLHALREEQAGRLARLAEAGARCAGLEQAAPDGDMTRAALSRAQSVMTQAQALRDRLREDLAMLNGSITTLAEQGIEEQLDETRGRLAEAEARAARYAAEAAALTRLRLALDEARRKARETYLGPVVRELQPLLSVLHPGATLEIDDATLLPAALTRGGQAEALEILSGGTREQVAILTRLAFARLFAHAGTSVPVILDDALVHSDDDRIEAMFTALHRVAQDQQILVLTCRQRAFAALGGEKAQVVVAPV